MKLKQILMMTPLYDWLGKRSFAQSGEDIIAWGEMKNSKTQKIKNSRTSVIFSGWIPGQARNDKNETRGFYVDVGAYHPKVFSNTYLFYKKGWSGICIEPNPEMQRLFGLARPRDVFLNLGVGGEIRSRHSDVENTRHFGEISPQLYSESRKSWMPNQVGNDKGVRLDSGSKPGMTRIENRIMEYFMFEDGAANTFSAEQAKKNQTEAGRKLIGKKTIPILSLKTILGKYLPKEQQIDLMSVDVEGMDLEVLRSNDWKKYRPKMIIAEDLDFDLEKYRGWIPGQARNDKCGVVEFLNSEGYRLVAKTPYSLLFLERSEVIK